MAIAAPTAPTCAPTSNPTAAPTKAYLPILPWKKVISSIMWMRKSITSSDESMKLAEVASLGTFWVSANSGAAWTEVNAPIQD